MLYELIKPYSSVSLIGMCKNAGKTTVLNRLIKDCRRMDESIALTSIGRDGERSDLVTNTKTPEINVYDGTIIATAEKLLFAGGNLSDSGYDALKNGKNSGISREILDTTGMPTPMGEVIILRACSDGFIQLAGPSMTAQLARLWVRRLRRRVRHSSGLPKKHAKPANTCVNLKPASRRRDIRQRTRNTPIRRCTAFLATTDRQRKPPHTLRS